MEFKVGDKVKLVRKNDEGEWYEKYLGQMFTIKDIEEDWKGRFAVLKEKGTLMPYLKNLELVEETYTYEDLKKSPIGTKVTFEKGRTLIKIDENYYRETNENGIIRYFNNLKGLKDNYHDYLNQGRIIKIEEPKYTTVYEYKPKILDNTEKRYLSNVIRPFRDKIKYISKYHSSAVNKEYIYIRIPNNTDIMLPYFEENTMYKDMRLDKEYTLEELGI